MGQRPDLVFVNRGADQSVKQEGLARVNQRVHLSQLLDCWAALTDLVLQHLLEGAHDHEEGGQGRHSGCKVAYVASGLQSNNQASRLTL